MKLIKLIKNRTGYALPYPYLAPHQTILLTTPPAAVEKKMLTLKIPHKKGVHKNLSVRAWIFKNGNENDIWIEQDLCLNLAFRYQTLTFRKEVENENV